MKHLKTFENLNQNPKIGDYVIPYPANARPGIENYIGIISNYDGNQQMFTVKYYEKNWRYTFWVEELEYWSSNKEELEKILQTRKYNL